MNQESLNQLRHSCAHLLAAAVEKLYPAAKRTIGPPIEHGFYYDFDFGDDTVSEADLPKIEKQMKKILPTWKAFSHKELSAEDARSLFADNPYKLELIDEIVQKGESITIYTCGEFDDLCRGGHVENPKDALKHFKLTKVAGAYWRGNEKNKMLTRIYGTCFPTQEELDTYLKRLEEAKARDHRKLGKELDLFAFSELVGPGLPLFTPKGTVLREELNRYSQELREAVGYQKVWIPHITKKELYETSGHWAKFGDELFLVKSQETSDALVMKPMNCPHHHQIFASKARSYRDLPMKYMETTTIYRDEKAGELLGLSRVRSITQDDSHIYCTVDQIESIIGELIHITQTFYATVGMPLTARLSYHDPAHKEKYLGESALWQQAEEMLLRIAQQHNLDFYEAVGEAAFYGPKIDFMATDALGRQWQVATPQLDFVVPKRFGLTYTDADGTEKTPVVIHFALMGSIERFLSVYIEHTAGAFPVWVSPTQVQFIPVSEKHVSGAGAFAGECKAQGFRVACDEADETVGNKIRKAAKQKIPYVVVVGDKELAGEDWMIRVRGKEEQISMKKDAFFALVREKRDDRAR